MQAILKAVSKFGGLKLEGEEDWINPTNEAKDDILSKLEEIKSYKGMEIKLVMAGNKYSGFEVSDKPRKGKDNQLMSYALSYAKDLAVAGKIEVNDIELQTEKFYKILSQ